MADQRPKRCSVCDQRGHNKRRCPTLPPRPPHGGPRPGSGVRKPRALTIASDGEAFHFDDRDKLTRRDAEKLSQRRPPAMSKARVAGRGWEESNPTSDGEGVEHASHRDVAEVLDAVISHLRPLDPLARGRVMADVQVALEIRQQRTGLSLGCPIAEERRVRKLCEDL